MSDVVRLGKLFTALYNSNDGERSSAASLLYNWMRNNNIHPDAIVVDVKGEREARFDRLMQRFEDENRKLRRENDFFRAHTDPKLRAKAQKAGQVENRWPEFEAMICQRMHVRKLPARGWQEAVMQATGAGKGQLQKWRAGLAPIPDAAFDKLRATPALVITQPPPRKRAPKPSVRSDQLAFTPELVDAH
jgi:hypothetical protein